MSNEKKQRKKFVQCLFHSCCRYAFPPLCFIAAIYPRRMINLSDFRMPVSSHKLSIATRLSLAIIQASTICPRSSIHNSTASERCALDHWHLSGASHQSAVVSATSSVNQQYNANERPVFDRWCPGGDGFRLYGGTGDSVL
jgi:hypothetical protein